MATAMAAASAQAQEQKAAKTAIVAIFPLDTQDSKTNIFSKPVADAVAKTLRSELGKKGEFEIEVLSAKSSLPDRVDLVVDGRIVPRSSRRVQLEAQIRDPDGVNKMAAVATRTKSITKIDELAVDLGRRLAPAIAQAIENKRTTEPLVMPETVIESEPDDNPKSPEAPVRGDKSPPLVVFDAAGKAAQGAVPVADVATRCAYKLVRAMGYRPVASRKRGLIDGATAAAVMKRSQARYGLMMEVMGVEFGWYGVLTARGKVRVVVVDDLGRAVYDQTHRTDTVVGSRGDRHAALVRFVMAQVHDIFRPDLAPVLKPRKKAKMKTTSGHRSPPGPSKKR